jgi:hypothetical protein
MRASVLACLAAVAALAACGAAVAQSRYVVTVQPAGPVKGFQKLKLSKAAVGTTPIILWRNAAINPDCSAVPGVTLKVLRPPQHGAATLTDGPVYVSFPAANPRAACNSRKVPGHEVTYQAASGYSGHDRVVLQGSSPDGHVRQVSIDIDVR